jgi:hypothetical protein
MHTVIGTLLALSSLELSVLAAVEANLQYVCASLSPKLFCRRAADPSLLEDIRRAILSIFWIRVTDRSVS